MADNNRDQLEAFKMVRHHLKCLSNEKIHDFDELIRPYTEFRKKIARFHERHLTDICTKKCFTSRTSGCCNRDGIATFFADVVINCLTSSDKDLDYLKHRLLNDPGGHKCIYLSENGCIWNLKPIICEMFLCDHAKNRLGVSGDQVMNEWQGLLNREKDFTWPDKQVLFDEIESIFMQAGFDSPIMYFHKSPGLLRIKKNRK